MKKVLFGCGLLCAGLAAKPQALPVSLRSDVSVQFIMNVAEKAARVAKDPVSGDLFYITSKGEIYTIKNLGASPYDQLVYTTADHGIEYLQGLAFRDSAMFVIGNDLIDSTLSIGLVKKAVLQPSGSRVWVTVAYTQQYAQSWTWYDHGYSGLVISPDKSSIYISSGSRTDHGEEQNNYGAYPGMREVPLTSVILKIPANSVNLFLPNDSALLAPYIFADGTRNSFDLAFDGNNNLFACENSGDRDDPDELNWVRQGRHYGFPWNLGGNTNPQQFPSYNPANDQLLNSQSHCAIEGYYYNDPAFPPVPGGLVFTPSVRNLGPDADKYRTGNGNVQDGSTSGNNVTSFTPHRCPLGLAFDVNGILAGDLKSSGFVLSFTRGGDSTGLDQYGYPGTVCDPGQDLLHLELSPDGNGEYQMNATTIVNNFDYPVDSYLDGNVLYVIEYAYAGQGRLFAVNLPLDVSGMDNLGGPLQIYPNPCEEKLKVRHAGARAMLRIYNVLGELVLSETTREDGSADLDVSLPPAGIYFAELERAGWRVTRKLVKK
jgi:glucose/arabinose dehydrogenase